jgi:RNA polymerase subunit RPABC4/transcription elongation factor Spt4
VDREWKRRHCRRCLAPVDAACDHCPYCGGEVQ